jgi:hypothetical protein
MQLGLGLVPPWQVKACAFDADRRRLGYRSTRTLVAIAYLIAGNLDLRLPT